MIGLIAQRLQPLKPMYVIASPVGCGHGAPLRAVMARATSTENSLVIASKAALCV